MRLLKIIKRDCDNFRIADAKFCGRFERRIITFNNHKLAYVFNIIKALLFSTIHVYFAVIDQFSLYAISLSQIFDYLLLILNRVARDNIEFTVTRLKNSLECAFTFFGKFQYVAFGLIEVCIFLSIFLNERAAQRYDLLFYFSKRLYSQFQFTFHNLTIAIENAVHTAFSMLCILQW
jgi:hypothetical protein